jgi:hypothetical protein
MDSFTFGVLEGMGDAVDIVALGGFSGDGVELIHVRLRGSGRLRNVRMCAGFSLGGGGGDVSHFVARVPRF